MRDIETADADSRHSLPELLKKTRERLELEDLEIRQLETEARSLPDPEERRETLGIVELRRCKWRLDWLGLKDVEHATL